MSIETVEPLRLYAVNKHTSNTYTYYVLASSMADAITAFQNRDGSPDTTRVVFDISLVASSGYLIFSKTAERLVAPGGPYR